METRTRIFVSYSRVDRPFVRRLVPLLREIFDIWFDEDLQGGQEWWNQILTEISRSGIFLYLLSNEAIGSEYCRAELAEALRLQKVVLPVLIRDRTPIPRDLSQLQYVDMSGDIDERSIIKLVQAIANLSMHVPAATTVPTSPHPIALPADQDREPPVDAPAGTAAQAADPRAKVQYALGLGILDSASEEVASHLERVSSIQIKEDLRSGQSGSRVLLVDVQPVGGMSPPGPSGPHYLKIHHDDTKKDSLQWIDSLAKTAVGRVMPPMVDSVIYKGRLAVLYRPAKRTTRSQDVASLAELLSENVSLAIAYVQGLADLLGEWNRQLTIRLYQPRDLLVELLGERRVSGEQSVQNRVWRSLGISDQDIRLLVGGELLLPNPMAFLSHASLWESKTNQAIAAPLGHLHGDLHAGNLICQRQETTVAQPPLLPDILDFATYQPNQLIFFDFAYLEFDLLTRLFSFENPDERREVLILLDYLTRRGAFALPPGSSPGSYRSHAAADLLRPLRLAVQGFFEQRPEDFENAFWIAAVAVGLNFARKRTASVSRYLNLLGVMYAGAALKRVLDSLRISYRSENVPSIAWIDRKWEDSGGSE